MIQSDKRQLLKMQEIIACFKRNTILLSSFIGSIDFLYRALEERNEIWEHSVFDILTDLDSVNAYVPESMSDDELNHYISVAILKLEKLINERLQNTLEFQVTLEGVVIKFIDLLEDKISHEDAANWAYSLIEQEELDNVICLPIEDKEKIFQALKFLCTIDHKNEVGDYLNNKEQIRNELHKLK